MPSNNYGTETTPLAAVGAAAKNILTRENTDRAMTFAREELGKLGESAKRGDLSIRALALMGGIAMCVTAILGLMGRFVTLHWIRAIMYVYLIVLGLLVIFLEGKRFAKLPPTVNEGIRKYAYFLDFIWGRGCLYFFIGSLQMSQASVVDCAVGGYMCIVGVTYIVMGRRTAKKLAELRKNLYSESQLREKFSAADVENRNTINCDQFRGLLQQFGIVLNVTEAETAFLQIEKTEDERISFEQFAHWWKTAEFDNDQNAQFALSV